MKHILSKIRQRREELQLSQENLAHELGIKQPAYNKIENGTTSMQHVQLLKIAKVLDMDFIDLIPEDSGLTINSYQQSGGDSKNIIIKGSARLVKAQQQLIEKQMQLIEALMKRPEGGGESPYAQP